MRQLSIFTSNIRPKIAKNVCLISFISAIDDLDFNQSLLLDYMSCIIALYSFQ